MKRKIAAMLAMVMVAVTPSQALQVYASEDVILDYEEDMSGYTVSDESDFTGNLADIVVEDVDAVSDDSETIIQMETQTDTETQTDAGDIVANTDTADELDGTETDQIIENGYELGMGITIEESEEVENPGIALASENSTLSGTCGTNATWTFVNGVLTISGSGEMEDYSTSNSPGWYDNRYSITSIVIENGITKVGKMAFYDCNNLTSVFIADSVTSFGYTVFAECRSLTSVTLPAGVTEIPYAMFANCSELTSLTAPGVTTFDDYAFQNTGFTTFTVGAKVTDISSLAFFKDGSLTTFAVESGNTTYTAAGGVLFTDGGSTLFAYPAGRTDTSYTIPNTVIKIGALAFAYSNLQQVNFGSGVTYIGDSAFKNSGLTSVSIPDSVTSTDAYTFYNCKNLETVTFGTGLEETSYEMFENCSALTTINFGSKLTSLYARTFAYCSALTSVTLPPTITEIGNACFGYCTKLASFSCDALTQIPYQAFCGDTALTSVTLCEGLTTINRYAFSGCTSLLKVVLPSTITVVYENAFETCTQLVQTGTNLTVYGENGLQATESVTVSGTRDYTNAYAVLEIVNQQRTANGLSALVMNESLLETAMQRAAETSVLFSHTRPDGSSCYSLNSLMMGENIACGYTTANAVMNCWMNSSGHKENILETSFTTIGIGCFVIDGVYYWVQCFGTGSDTSSCVSPSNTAVSPTIAIATGTFQEASTTSGVSWGTSLLYKYELDVKLDSSQISVNETTTASVYLLNPGNRRLTKISAIINWSSSDTTVATVDSATVKGVKAGSADITAATQSNAITGKTTITVTAPTSTSDSTTSTTLASGKITGLTNTTTGVKIAWNKISGASGYYIYRKTSGGTYTRIKTITKVSTVSYTDTSVSSGTTYYYYVKAYKGNSTGGYSEKSIKYLAPGEISKLTNKSSGITVSWSKVSGASGYYIYRKTASGSYKKIKTITKASTVSWTDTSIKSKNGTKYTYKVVPYSGSTTGSFKSKTTVRLTGVKLSKANNISSGKLTVQWKKNAKTSGYQIQYSTSSTFAIGNKTVKVSGSSKLSRTVSKLSKNKTYYVRVRAYKTVSGKTYYSAWSNVKKVKITK